jgi:hypothetical protein
MSEVMRAGLIQNKLRDTVEIFPSNFKMDRRLGWVGIIERHATRMQRADSVTIAQWKNTLLRWPYEDDI